MTLRRHILLGAAAAALPLPLFAQTTMNAPVVTGGSVIPQTNVVDSLAAAGGFNSFLEYARMAGAIETLRGAGPFTLFALPDPAVDMIPIALREDMAPSTGGSNQQRQQGDQVRLQAFVNMHIVEGRYTTADFANRVVQLRTRNGNTLQVTAQGSGQVAIVLVGNSGFGVGGANAYPPANLAGPQILASNGIVLPVNRPLIQ
ncbi:fasciclin domain-containing protein [Roseococcus sp. SYP-B2431]|uniref:fasciclin domain-containing protein n=1 Tax=Roseococcus sp. SYP-B2431 TaxID=2496640 RepID=UPI0013F3BBC4|nr:fasciclin domain-containing protein [Roseococcus sp. SYP-B2431]